MLISVNLKKTLAVSTWSYSKRIVIVKEECRKKDKIFVKFLGSSLNSWPWLFLWIDNSIHQINHFVFFQAGTVMNPAIWLVLSEVQIFLSLTTVTVTLVQVFFSEFFFVWELGKKKNHLFTGLGSVHIVKNCDLGPWSQFFTIRTSQPANNIYIQWTV